MNKYIDLNKVIAYIKNTFDWEYNEETPPHKLAMKIIQEIKKDLKGDMIEIVRCKECVKRNTNDCCLNIMHESYSEDDGWDFWWEDLTEDEFYCADGDKRNNI